MHRATTLLLSLACTGLGLLAQAATELPAPAAPLGKADFHARREALAKLVATEHDGPSIVFIRGASKPADMGPFVQDQDFYYLAGVNEPGLALLLVPGPDGSLVRDELLVPPFSRFAATWDGTFLAPGDEAAQRTGFATVGNVRNLEARLDDLLAAPADGQPPRLVTLTKPAARLGSTPGRAAEVAASGKEDPLDGRPSREEALVLKETVKHASLAVVSLETFLHRLRPLKSPGEQALLRRSAQIAAEGIGEAMKSARPGLYEFQLAAVARYVFSLRGAGPDAYAAIVGGGPNGCILHYSVNSRQLQADDLIVMDYAPTLQGYASDVTRTFPASGKFSPSQRRLVQDVYEIQQALLACVKPGARLSELSKKCAAMLKERGYRSDHGPSHHVGLAVHDPSVDVLAAGMILTVEPGAYLRDQGMGCRIEDTVLVTEQGFENLSGAVPSSPDAIEALMQQRGIVDVPVGLPR